MRRALAGVIVQVEELVACEGLTAESEFDFLLIQFGSEFPRDAGEIGSLIKKVVFFQIIANRL